MDATDNSLLRDFVESCSEAAFAALVARHANLVARIIKSRIRDQAACEDLVQLVFCLMARKAKTLVEHPSIPGWLVQTAVFESKKHLRSEANRMKRETLHHQLAQQEEAAFTDEQFACVAAAIAGLPEKFRAPLLMRYYEGETYRAIAERIGRSEGASQKLVSRAIEALRGLVERRSAGVGSAAAFTALLTATLSPKAGAAPNASALASASLELSSGVSTAALISNTIYTMTATQLKIGAAVALVATIPIALQWSSNRDLRERVAELETGASMQGASATGNRYSAPHALTKGRNSPEVHRSGAVEAVPSTAELLKSFDVAAVRGGRRSQEWQNAMRSLSALDAAQLKGLIGAIAMTDYGALAKKEASHAIVEQLSRIDPGAAADYLLETVGPAALGRAMKEWAQRDPEGAYSWLINKQRTGDLLSRGTDGAGHQNPFSELLTGMAIADPSRALSAWADVPHDLGPESLQGVVGSLRTDEHRQAFLNQVQTLPDETRAATASLAYAIGLGQLVPLEEVVPEISRLELEPAARSQAILEIASEGLFHGGEVAASNADWLIESSAPDAVGANVRDSLRDGQKETSVVQRLGSERFKMGRFAMLPWRDSPAGYLRWSLALPFSGPATSAILRSGAKCSTPCSVPGKIQTHRLPLVLHKRRALTLSESQPSVQPQEESHD